MECSVPAGAAEHSIGASPAVEDPAYVVRLAGVLDLVVRDADQPHTECHRRVPACVDHTIEGLLGDRLQKPASRRRDGCLVVEKRLRTFRADGRYIARRVSPAGVGRIRGDAEAAAPVAGDPDLIAVEDVSHVVVLDADEVPDEPTDRIRAFRERRRQGVDVEPVDRSVHLFVDSAEQLEQEFVQFHSTIVPRWTPCLNSAVGRRGGVTWRRYASAWLAPASWARSTASPTA